jgi:hypothetical protein
VVVDGIPVGPEYTVLIGIVQQRPGGWFSTEGWGESINPFEVVPGEIITVPITIQSWSEFYPVEPLMGENIKDMESDGTAIYVADATNVHVSDLLASWSWDPAVWSSYAVSGQSINSLTIGIDMAQVPNIFSQLWANTNESILPFIGTGFDSPLTASLGQVSILDSAVGYDSTWSNQVLYFRRAEGIGGTFIPQSDASDPSQWNWANLDTERTHDMSFGIEGGAAFATTETAFRVPEGLLLDSTPSLGEHRSTIITPSPIRSLHIYDNDAAEELFVGTEDGAWKDEAWDFPDQGLMQQADTKGYPIRKLAFESSYSYWIACLSDIYLFVVDDTGSLVGKYPFVSGFPGEVNNIAWAYDGGSLAYLFVATDEGLVYKSFFVGGV